MANEEKFAFESFQDPETIREYLQSITDGIEKGRILLATGDEEIVLHPGVLLKFAVKAKKKSGGSKLSLTISWKETPKSSAVGDTNISISS